MAEPTAERPATSPWGRAAGHHAPAPAPCGCPRYLTHYADKPDGAPTPQYVTQHLFGVCRERGGA